MPPKTVLNNINCHLLGVLMARRININEWYVEGRFECPTNARLVTLRTETCGALSPSCNCGDLSKLS